SWGQTPRLSSSCGRQGKATAVGLQRLAEIRHTCLPSGGTARGAGLSGVVLRPYSRAIVANIPLASWNRVARTGAESKSFGSPGNGGMAAGATMKYARVR